MYHKKPYRTNYIMSEIDRAIYATDNNICENIAAFDASHRGLLCQNILSQLRNLVEYIASKAYGEDMNITIEPNNYKQKKKAINYMESNHKLRLLRQLYNFLQQSASHYTREKDASERLFIKYYEYLLKIKLFLKDNYSMEILSNINQFPLDTDTDQIHYYTIIAQKIDDASHKEYNIGNTNRYYIHKIKPFFVNEKIYYEITYTSAIDNVSKFNRSIAFTAYDILPNYAVRLNMHDETIDVLGEKINISIIDSWNVSIRECELKNFAKILGVTKNLPSVQHKEYVELMRYITQSHLSLPEIVDFPHEKYTSIKMEVTKQSKVTNFFDLLDKCRSIIKKDQAGSNILRYLLYNLNNVIIKYQYSEEECERLSNLNLKWKCIPFDNMPYCTSLPQHNPHLHDLLHCIPYKDKEDEFLARYIKNNTEANNILFTPINELNQFEHIEQLIETYNHKLYFRHKNRELHTFKQYIYIEEYTEDSYQIINKLQEISKVGIDDYTNSVNCWLQKSSHNINSPEKKEVLKTIFSDSHLALIYGSAGTGKTTMINYFANYFDKKDKLLLANTHPAVDNLRRYVSAPNCTFNTVAKFNATHSTYPYKCDILIIDECSVVSNSDMRDILEHCDFKVLILAGDIYQIESIRYGNWFEIAQYFIKKSAIANLKKTYRTEEAQLITLWDRVRWLNDDISEQLNNNHYSSKLDSTIFTKFEEDEIVLCLNYNGLYGINNINKILQSHNSNAPYKWGTNTYKVGDPILFNENNRFSPLIHNNSKGTIRDIKIKQGEIWFDIELDHKITNKEATLYTLDIVNYPNSSNTTIRFRVLQSTDTDSDDNDPDSLVPFQVAYAVSMHKAQGLEYDSVKIIITDETEESISHNIFYTAITRAKKTLKIYWSPEIENRILNRFKHKDSKRDMRLLQQLYNIEDN